MKLASPFQLITLRKKDNLHKWLLSFHVAAVRVDIPISINLFVGNRSTVGPAGSPMKQRGRVIFSTLRKSGRPVKNHCRLSLSLLSVVCAFMTCALRLLHSMESNAVCHCACSKSHGGYLHHQSDQGFTSQHIFARSLSVKTLHKNL